MPLTSSPRTKPGDSQSHLRDLSASQTLAAQLVGDASTPHALTSGQVAERIDDLLSTVTETGSVVALLDGLDALVTQLRGAEANSEAN